MDNGVVCMCAKLYEQTQPGPLLCSLNVNNVKLMQKINVKWAKTKVSYKMMMYGIYRR